MANIKPLTGVRVIACEAIMALPFATQMLADFGADVIGIEHIDWRPDSETSAWRLRTGRHKRRIAVNLREESGQEIVRRLIRGADVFASNFRPGVIDRYGLGYEQVRDINPGVVYASLSGFGTRNLLPSPYENVAAFGPIAEATGGVANSMGHGRGAEALALGDIVSALFAANGIMMALRHRDRTGVGQLVDVAMADSLLALNERAILMHLLAAEQDPTDSREPAISSYYIYDDVDAGDGRVTIMLSTADHWARFSGLLGHSEWADDPEIADPATRRARVTSIVFPVLQKWARGLGKKEAGRQLQQAGLPAAAVLLPPDILEDPHYAAREMLIPTRDADGVVRPMIGSPIKLSSMVRDPQRSAEISIATPGQHTREILSDELHLSEEQIDELLRRNVVRDSREAAELVP
ncbi:CoA transferase [Rhodococcus sp. T2V]|uniref:CaiB/BaiF CoA transferase family protein n=1 Tax=Rhodococcus sp. T2V TaxID=3034164 RepID=UPI0023E2AA36|nr:CoA transferase [Rhodococcus sp. T2V]MDF3311472.1 CoA transferase [Rhodococcus sp. T2V]